MHWHRLQQHDAVIMLRLFFRRQSKCRIIPDGTTSAWLEGSCVIKPQSRGGGGECANAVDQQYTMTAYTVYDNSHQYGLQIVNRLVLLRAMIPHDHHAVGHYTNIAPDHIASRLTVVDHIVIFLDGCWFCESWLLLGIRMERRTHQPNDLVLPCENWRLLGIRMERRMHQPNDLVRPCENMCLVGIRMGDEYWIEKNAIDTQQHQ